LYRRHGSSILDNMGIGTARRAVALSTAVLGVPLSGPPATGQDQPSLELREPTTDFGAVVVETQELRTVRIVNLGQETVTIGAVAVTGEGFSVVFDNCSGAQVEQDDSCAVTIGFQPQQIGAAAGEVSVSDPVALTGELFGVGVMSDVSSPSTEPPATGPPPTQPPETDPPGTEPPTTSTPGTSQPPDTVPPTTPPSTAPPITVPEGDLAERLAACDAEAESAEVRYSPTLEMVVGEITDVEVTAAIDDAQPPGTGSSPPTTEVPAVLQCEVEATLHGQAFEVDPAGAQSGSFLLGPSITWTWQVTPTLAGEHTLHFDILPIVRGDGLELPGTPVPFEATIDVRATPVPFWTRVNDTLKDVGGHPFVSGFGGLTAIAGVSAGIWRWILRRPWPWAGARDASPDGHDRPRQE
jgi:hypothetical protein